MGKRYGTPWAEEAELIKQFTVGDEVEYVLRNIYYNERNDLTTINERVFSGTVMSVRAVSVIIELINHKGIKGTKAVRPSDIRMKERVQ